MDKKLLKKFQEIFKAHSEVKLAYIFGSQATHNTGPLSDYDFAVFLDEQNNQKIFNIKAKLLDELSRLLATDNVDLVVLDNAQGSELKYNVIASGQLIHHQEPYRLKVEPRIFNEYFDFKKFLAKAA